MANQIKKFNRAIFDKLLTEYQEDTMYLSGNTVIICHPDFLYKHFDLELDVTFENWAYCSYHGCTLSFDYNYGEDDWSFVTLTGYPFPVPQYPRYFNIEEE